MKIKDSSEISGLRPDPRPSTPVRHAPAADRVSVKGTHELSSAIAAGRSSAAQSREARLAEVEKSVKAGTYKPQPSQTAESIVSSAELDAAVKRSS